MILLDTDVLSIVQRASGSAYERLVSRLDAADDDVAVSIVGFEEQMRGWLAYIAKAKSSKQQIEAYARLHALLEDFRTRPVVGFDHGAAAEFERLLRLKDTNWNDGSENCGYSACSPGTAPFKKPERLRESAWVAC